MAFIRKHHKSGINYFSMVKTCRIEGKVRQIQLEWLGDYDQACLRLAASSHITQAEQSAFADKLAHLEGGSRES
jgi:hypothetical protein